MQTLIRRIDDSPFLTQAIPLALTLIIFGGLTALLHASILLFNLLPVRELVVLEIQWVDVLVGGTIYLKTSIDFAIFMGRLMAANPGWKNRIAIEIGTALGNAAGTILVIGLWVLFKDIHLLLALMVFFASLVLFELAHGSLEHFQTLTFPYRILKPFLDVVTRFTPKIGINMQSKQGLTWKKLLLFSASVPFILGLDDFAGYVPLFNVVNVYGFAIGVIGAHTLLNICLFLSPKRTIAAVKNAWISFLGTLAFIGLAIYGLVETGKILLEMFT